MKLKPINEKLKFQILGSKHHGPKKIYVRTNCQVEKWCEIVYIIMIKSLPLIFTMPNVIVSFFNYFVIDLGNDSFELTIPMW